ncbi:MAG: glycosyl hydrolase, partial [Opitutaceae bacterium]
MRPPRRPILALFMLLLVARATGADALDAGFAAPPPIARPLVWWHWINGNVTKHGIEADLADMKRVGIAGVQMFDASIYLPPGPVRYGTDPWHEHVQHAIATADKLGLEFHLMNTPGWSASGGPWVTPERSMKKLVWSEPPATGGGRLTLAVRMRSTIVR